ncbi:hypothetical protein LAZ67_4000536 [Cordylochernes scorpioides]|uniref:Transposase n=1 Tax=Cordylochernes scorpioides TaxID=51811 RepID=A0ABY6KD86_9ARAC|nr:hypothetical protein LAZ67_4000536 [Cordylochernes scorpioides]
MLWTCSSREATLLNAFLLGMIPGCMHTSQKQIYRVWSDVVWGRIVNQHFHREVLDRLFTRIKKRQFWSTKYFFLLHDNARPHTTILIDQFLAKKGVSLMLHPLIFRIFRFATFIFVWQAGKNNLKDQDILSKREIKQGHS